MPHEVEAQEYSITTEDAPLFRVLCEELGNGNAHSYSFPRKIFATPRIAFSLRRYHRHCPFLVASTSPALVKIAIWWEIVGCESCTRSSISPAHKDCPVATLLCPAARASASPCFNACKILRRVGSAMACNARSRDSSVDDMDGLGIQRGLMSVNLLTNPVIPTHERTRGAEESVVPRPTSSESGYTHRRSTACASPPPP